MSSPASPAPSEARPPFPPFTRDSAIEKVRLAEDGWNSRDPVRVSLAYTHDSPGATAPSSPRAGREIVAFLSRKWAKELDYRLIKELWAVEGNRIAVRYAYEWHDDSGNWFRSYGNENWEFDAAGPDAAPLRLHQRPADPGQRAQIPLAAGTPAGRTSGLVGTRPVSLTACQYGRRSKLTKPAAAHAL